MASRAHVLHDYSFGRGSERPRRELRFRTDEPVNLPRTGMLRLGGGLILAALTAGALVAGSAYAVLYVPAPAMAVTPTTPLTRDFAANPELGRANVTNQLSGPAHAVPQLGTLGPIEEDVPMFSHESSSDSSPSSEVLIDDSAPGAQQTFPQPNQSSSLPPETPALPATTPEAPYPNPTLTPPEGIAPDASPQTPTPALDPENPYR